MKIFNTADTKQIRSHAGNYLKFYVLIINSDLKTINSKEIIFFFECNKLYITNLISAANSEKCTFRTTLETNVD